MESEETQELVDLINSMSNKIETVHILLLQERHDLLATQLEHIYEDAQKLIDDFCIKP